MSIKTYEHRSLNEKEKAREVNKSCSCGIEHKHMPSNTRVYEKGNVIHGYFWECECGSTLLIPLDKKGGRDENN